jgi:hypothetical protein
VHVLDGVGVLSQEREAIESESNRGADVRRKGNWHGRADTTNQARLRYKTQAGTGGGTGKRTVFVGAAPPPRRRQEATGASSSTNATDDNGSEYDLKHQPTGPLHRIARCEHVLDSVASDLSEARERLAAAVRRQSHIANIPQ